MPKSNIWATHSLQSGFGDQSISTKASSPSVGFGSSFREGMDKLYTSKEQDKAKSKSQGGGERMGPCYNIPSTFANTKMPVSNIESAPAVGFGFGGRSGASSSSSSSCSQSPGPGAYKIDDNGSTMNSRKKGGVPFGMCSRDTAGKVFISAEHDKVAPGGVDSPGPAAYSVGESMKAVKKRAPVAVIGGHSSVIGGGGRNRCEV